jgi:HK97 family phage prohead protease
VDILYRNKTSILAASIKDTDSKKGIVTGYFSSFGNKDSDGDIIVSGAFAKTIEDRGPASKQPRIKHLMNHQIDKPLGKLMELKEDDKGLYYESQIAMHTLGKDFVKMVEGGLITEHSIGYRPIKWENDNDDSSITYLNEIQLWEGSSLTGWGANAQTPMTGMKQDDIGEMILQHNRVEKFCRDTTASDETVEELLLYNKQLLQKIINFTTTTKPELNSTMPGTEANNDTSKWSGKTDSIIQLFNSVNHEKGRKTKWCANRSRIATYL